MRYLIVVAVVSLQMGAAQAESLKQKQAAVAYKTSSQGSLTEIKGACGCAPSADVKNWSQFTNDEEMKIPQQGLDEAADALKKVCNTDAESKKAVCAQVKTIVVNNGGAAGAKAPTFAKGVLTLTRVPHMGYGDVAEMLKNSL